MIRDIVDIDGYEVTFTWIDSKEFQHYRPITQIWGFCFTDKGELLIGREDKDSGWRLPGGSLEAGESISQALARETSEELDAEIHEIQPFGLQEIRFPGNPDKKQGELFYQARSIAKVKALNPQTPDPCCGKVWERKLIDPKDLLEYFRWRNVGAYLRERLIGIQAQLKSK